MTLPPNPQPVRDCVSPFVIPPVRDTIEGHFGWWARIPPLSPSRGTSFFHSAAPHPAVTSSFLSTGSFPLASTSSSEFKTHMKQTALNHIVP